MGNVLDNSLYMNDQKKFQELFQAVIQFNSLYNGNNIIQDDIFSVLTNYARKKQEDLDLFRFPTKDDDFCALTCVPKGRLVFFREKNGSVLRKGSILNAAVMDEDVKCKEDLEANAFAGLLLVPSNALYEQMQIYGIPKSGQVLGDMIRLMAIFSVPYKAVLLRLYEEGYINTDTVYEFLNVKKEVLRKAVSYEPDAERWQRRTPEILRFGSLKQLMDQNSEYDLLSDKRNVSDQETLCKILHRYEAAMSRLFSHYATISELWKECCFPVSFILKKCL